MTDEERRVIWLLVRKLGGVVFITEAELAVCPDLPGLTWGPDPENGGVFLAARRVNPVVRSAVIRREIEDQVSG